VAEPLSGNRLLKTLSEGRRAFGIPIRSADPAIIEICAIAGYDWVSITLEHAALTVRDIAVMQRAADARGITTLIHLAEPHDHRTLALLDEGVGGVVGVHVEDAAEAQDLVHAARFPPLGERGAAGVTRRADYGAKSYASYTAEADAAVAVGVVIETKAGIENAAEILAVEGLSLVYVGFNDLSQSYGIPFEFTHPTLREAVEHVIECAHKNGVAVGLSEKGFTIEELCDLGVDMIINAPAGEYAALLQTLTSRLEQARATADKSARVRV
jgi:4-hydroxy-2-oxoheptanedioate aldolase